MEDIKIWKKNTKVICSIIFKIHSLGLQYASTIYTARSLGLDNSFSDKGSQFTQIVSSDASYSLDLIYTTRSLGFHIVLSNLSIHSFDCNSFSSADEL